MNRVKKFDDILTPGQVSDLNKLTKELAVEAQRKKMAGASKPILAELKGEMKISLPKILSRPVVITNHLLRGLGRDRTPLYRKLLTDLVRNPEDFLRAYKMPEKTTQARMAIDIIERLEIIFGAKAIEESNN